MRKVLDAVQLYIVQCDDIHCPFSWLKTSSMRCPCVLQGYLAALSASSYSYVSMVQRFGPLMNEGGAAISLTYIASERIIPG